MEGLDREATGQYGDKTGGWKGGRERRKQMTMEGQRTMTLATTNYEDFECASAQPIPQFQSIT